MSCCKTGIEKVLSADDLYNLNNSIVKEKFPIKRYAFCLIINMSIGFVVIGFQIAAIAMKSPLYYVGVGYYVS